MPIRAQIGNIKIETDTAREMAAMLAALGINLNGTAAAAAQTTTAPASRERLAALLAELPERQRAVIDMLRAGPATDSALRTLLSFQTNNELAGVMGGIGKNAKAHQLVSADIYRRITAPGDFGEGSHYVYELTPAMVGAIERTEGESPE